jgi:hypothetical protein
MQLRTKQMELQKQLSQIRSQISAAERERKRAELTSQELKELPSGVRAFSAVGRMYFIFSACTLETWSILLICCAGSCWVTERS